MLTERQTNEMCDFFVSLQDRLISAFQKIDPDAVLEEKSWTKEEANSHENPENPGGGRSRVLRGPIVEKAGANFSKVHGASYPSIEKDYAGQPYFACGVSTITHMMNPHAPIAHANVRLLKVGKDRFWFGGGADLTPCFEYKQDTEEFHQSLREACNVLSADAYERYSKWCDEYFYIKHRKSLRGVGGIFFDYLHEGPVETLMEFVKRVGEAYVTTYPDILRRRALQPFSAEEKEQQLFWRGRYAEFNLVYDRGTKFGLMSGGNIDAIFVSLPPVVKW